MAYGYCAKIARINLTTGRITVERPDPALLRNCIGGRGLGTWILWGEGCADADPLGPDNKLVYATGPLTGAAIPFSSRYMVLTKSPLTGRLACANSGGSWGTLLKRAGWDALIVEGEAPAWTYISILDGQIQLLDARAYLGLYAEEADKILKEKHGQEAAILSTGIAGEQKGLLSTIRNDNGRCSGRGIGAVMGSKKLKAIVVTATAKNTDSMSVPDEALKAVSREILEEIRRNQPNENKASPDACRGCPIACGHGEKLSKRASAAPEGIVSPVLEEVQGLCNRYGLDAISVPTAIAAAMELYRRGFLREEDCDGIPLEQSSPQSWIAWTERMGNPKTKLERLMSAGAEGLCRHFGLPESEVLPPRRNPAVSDKKAFGGKASRDLAAVIDSLGLCLFTSLALETAAYTRLLNAAWGTDFTPEAVLETGKQICNMEHSFNEAALSKLERSSV